IGVGGGSVLDSGKALRTIATHSEKLIEYLRDSEKITKHVAPYITVPTTAGTGAEITFGGGIHPEANHHALPIRSMHVRPDVAICDPELTLTLPPLLTAATGMDAFGHCLEGFMATTVNPPIDAVALDGIARVATYIERAVADGGDREARWHMLMAALEGGMAIYKRLGPVHTLAHLFGDSPLHHGAMVALAMPAVIRFYEGHVDERLDKVAAAMGVASGAKLGQAVADLNGRVGLPAGVRELGYRVNDLDAISAEAAKGAFDATAPRKPTRAQYRVIIEEVLG
ncbi:MAG: iron-containing alcohol dehydrogenase, partial [Alphaproteobacteria bacterium]|nr:iron-containing alcohol dehydrogenase [Alphaproteobacteria bacterium]